MWTKDEPWQQGVQFKSAWLLLWFNRDEILQINLLVANLWYQWESNMEIWTKSPQWNVMLDVASYVKFCYFFFGGGGVHCFQKQRVQISIYCYCYQSPHLKQKKMTLWVWHLQSFFWSFPLGISRDILVLAWGTFNIVYKFTKIYKIADAQRPLLMLGFDRAINQSFWQTGFLGFMLKMVIFEQQKILI